MSVYTTTLASKTLTITAEVTTADMIIGYVFIGIILLVILEMTVKIWRSRHTI